MEKKKNPQGVNPNKIRYYCDVTEDLHNVVVLANNEQGGFVILQEVGKQPNDLVRTFVVYRNKNPIIKYHGVMPHEVEPADHIACKILKFVTKTGEEVGAEIAWKEKYGKNKRDK